MTERGYLGEFELMILLAVVGLGEEAYGVPISRELERHRGRSVAVGSVYAALDRLEPKGWYLPRSVIRRQSVAARQSDISESQKPGSAR